MMRLAITAFALLVGLMASQASAQVTGQFVLLQDGTALTSGDLVDVWGFQITNNSGQNVRTFENISFSGSFLQQPSSPIGRIDADLPILSVPGAGDFRVADTFFVDADLTSLDQISAFGATVDDETTLSAETIAVIADGVDWINNGATETIAIFSVAPDGSAPVFNGGSAVVLDGNGDRVRADISSAIPEPGSLAVLGLGGLAALVRRRR